MDRVRDSRRRGRDRGPRLVVEAPTRARTTRRSRRRPERPRVRCLTGSCARLSRRGGRRDLDAIADLERLLILHTGRSQPPRRRLVVQVCTRKSLRGWPTSPPAPTESSPCKSTNDPLTSTEEFGIRCQAFLLDERRPLCEGRRVEARGLRKRFAGFGISGHSLAVFPSRGEDSVMTRPASLKESTCKSWSLNHSMGL
jgi:hypothetical protein